MASPARSWPASRRPVAHGDVAGVEHVPVEVEGERAEGGPDGGGGGRGTGPALVAAHALIAAEAEDDGGRR